MQEMSQLTHREKFYTNPTIDMNPSECINSTIFDSIPYNKNTLRSAADHSTYSSDCP